MDTAVYLRVSSRSQDVESQEREVRRWLDGHGVSVEDKHWFRDTESGKDLDRPAFVRLQQAIFMGEVKRVVMYAVDRFARNFMDGLVELDRWQKAQVKVVFVADGLEIDYGSWMGDVIVKIMLAMRLAFAEAERNKIRTRQAAGIATAQEKSRKVWKQVREGKPVSLIARDLGLKVEQVERMIARGPGKVYWGGGEMKRRKAAPADVQRLIRAGHTIAETAQLLKCGPTIVVARIKELGGVKKIRARQTLALTHDQGAA